jgi:glycosyltransferase involved in cell wall biosynthesis
MSYEAITSVALPLPHGISCGTEANQAALFACHSYEPLIPVRTAPPQYRFKRGLECKRRGPFVNSIAVREWELFALKTIVSAGLGKLHFHETARAASQAGVEIVFLTGWAPGPGQEKFADFLGGLIGEKNLGKRLAARRVEGERVCFHSMALADFTVSAVGVLSRIHVIPKDVAAALGFRIFGAGARKYLKDADIFQVRSAAGQGGAIATARKNGLKVLVDHSIAHPQFMEDTLREEYARHGLTIDLGKNDALWTQVLKDCDEADYLLVNSDFVKHTFIKCGYPADRIRVAYLGVRESFLHLKQDYEIHGRIKLLFTGNFELRKGARVLLEAIRKLRAQGLDLRLELIGGLTNGKLALRDEDQEFFTWKPFVLPDELRPSLAAADLFVFPTLIEGSSRSAMEAAAAGLPIITTTHCGLPLVVGESVEYVPILDVEALASAIAKLAGDKALRERLGRNAANEISSHYTWGHYGNALAAIYREISSNVKLPVDSLHHEAHPVA